MLNEIDAILDGLFGTRSLMIEALGGDHSALQDADMNITGLINSVQRLREMASNNHHGGVTTGNCDQWLASAQWDDGSDFKPAEE